MRDLVPFVQFEKRAKHPWRSVTILFQPGGTLLKVTLLYGRFPVFKIVQMVQNPAKHLRCFLQVQVLQSSFRKNNITSKFLLTSAEKWRKCCLLSQVLDINIYWMCCRCSSVLKFDKKWVCLSDFQNLW